MHERCARSSGATLSRNAGRGERAQALSLSRRVRVSRDTAMPDAQRARARPTPHDLRRPRGARRRVVDVPRLSKLLPDPGDDRLQGRSPAADRVPRGRGLPRARAFPDGTGRGLAHARGDRLAVTAVRSHAPKPGVVEDVCDVHSDPRRPVPARLGRPTPSAPDRASCPTRNARKARHSSGRKLNHCRPAIRTQHRVMSKMATVSQRDLTQASPTA